MDWPNTKLSIFFKHVQKYNKTEKNTQKDSELGLDPLTHFRVFIGYLDFFDLTRTLSTDQGESVNKAGGFSGFLIVFFIVFLYNYIIPLCDISSP